MGSLLLAGVRTCSDSVWESLEAAAVGVEVPCGDAGPPPCPCFSWTAMLLTLEPGSKKRTSNRASRGVTPVSLRSSNSSLRLMRSIVNMNKNVKNDPNASVARSW